MNKIIIKLIKDCLAGSDLSDYILDFNNNIIGYKNIALYNADLSLLNINYFNDKKCKITYTNEIDNIMHNKKNYKLTKLKQNIEEVNNKYVRYECSAFTIFVDKKMISLLDFKNISSVEAENSKFITRFFDNNNNVIAAILPYRIRVNKENE